tara:strand:+ start:2977 stop:4437 length:1461 start_codon:yes stop_codon:yes gene_type:complete
MASKKILQGFLFLNISIVIYGYFIGFNKSLWWDELMSIYYAREISNLDLKEIFTQDANAPFFYLFLNSAEQIFRIFNINVDENVYLIRIVNLVGFIPILLSYKLLREEKTEIDIVTVFFLLISSNYFFYYILDLRPYFLLLSFTFLISVINLTDTVEGKHKYLFFLSSIIVSFLHIYGLTLSMSILSYRFIVNLYQKNLNRLKVDVCFITLLFLVFFLSYFLQITNSEVMSVFGYLKFQLWFVKAFIIWASNALIFLFFATILIIFLKKRKSSNVSYFVKSFLNKTYLNILGQTVPIIILLIVVLLVSFLVFPIIHFRQLIVIYPSLALIGGLLAYDLFRNNLPKIFLITFLLSATFINIKYYLKNIINTEQNIEWVVKKTFNQNCVGVDVYFNDDGREKILDYINPLVQIYSKNFRPVKSLSKLDLNNFLINKNCDILIFSFHTYDLEENLENLNYSGLNLNIKYAPNVVKDTSKSGAIVLVENK